MLEDKFSPHILSTAITSDNSALAVTLNEAVFNTKEGNGTLEVSDFALSLSGGSATLSSATPTSISVSGKTITLGFSLVGTPNGLEIITVVPLANSIFDIAGNVAATAQNNNSTNLLANEVRSGTNNLIGFWNFNETAGDTIYDKSIKNNHGKLNGGTFVSSAIVGRGVSLDGSDDFIETNQKTLNNLSQFTIAGWINPRTGGGREGLFGQNDLIEFGFQNNGRLWGWTQNGGDVTFNIDQNFYNQTHHLAFVGTGSKLLLYVDGELKSTGGRKTSNGYGTSSYDFNIGHGVYDPTGNWFDGDIYQVTVWDTVKSADFLSSIYKSVNKKVALDTTNDFESPYILSSTISNDNKILKVTFNEAVFSNNSASADLDVQDFTLSLNSGSALLSNATPEVLEKNGNEYLLNISFVGTPNGEETLTISPIPNSIYDAVGNVSSSNQTNNIVKLNSMSFTQLGKDIDGENIGDESGSSVSFDSSGTRVAIGAISNDGNGMTSGHVRVYDWNGSSWIQAGIDIDGEAPGDQFGWVRLNANGLRLAVGGRSNDGNGRDAGHVRIYSWDGSSWNQMGTDIDGEASNDHSGSSVSLNAVGNRVAIGAHDNDGTGSNAGHVRIFDWNGSDWKQLGDDIDGEAEGDKSGAYRTVRLNGKGDRVIIAGQNNDGTGSNAGHVRAYDWNGSSWIQAGSDIDAEAANDRSGIATALNRSGNRLAIGASRNDGTGSNAGHVRIFDWNGSDWKQLGDDIDGEATEDNSGTAVSMNYAGTRVAIGAQNNDGTASNAGHVRIYDWNGISWVQVGSDIDGEAEGDQSGSHNSVSLNAFGDKLAIGAFRNDGNGSNSGHVRIFSLPNPTITSDSRPMISSVNVSDDNSSVTVIFNEEVYSTKNGEGLLEVQDFILSLSGGTAIIPSPTPTAISGSGRIYTLGFGLSGSINSNEILSVFPKLNSIFNGAGTSALTNQPNNNDYLNFLLNKINLTKNTIASPGYEVDINSSGDRLITTYGKLTANLSPQYNSHGIKILNWNGSSWSDQDTITLGGYALPRSIAIDSVGSRIIVGAPDHDLQKGLVRVYDLNLNSGNWSPIGQDIIGSLDSEKLGTSVTINSSGSVIAFSSPFSRSNINSGKGFVSVYSFEENKWIPRGDSIFFDNRSSNNFDFNTEIALNSNGDRIVYSTNDGLSNNLKRIVKVFGWNGSVWNQIGNAIDSTIDWTSVSMNSPGNRLALGSNIDDQNGYNSGIVKIFDWNGKSWMQAGSELVGEVTEQFGNRVSLNALGNRLLISSNKQVTSKGYGHAKIFDWSGTEWFQNGGLINAGSGTAVAIGAGGFNLEAGAINYETTINDAGDRIALGTTYTTSLENSGVWTYSIPLPDYTSDPFPPTILSVSLSDSNKTISVLLSENVYNSGDGTGKLDVNDFEISLSQSKSSLASKTPSTISANGNIYTLGLPINDLIEPMTLLTISPVPNSIFDSNGNAASSNQNNNSIYLKDIEPPRILSVKMADNSINEFIIVNFDEKIFSSKNGSGSIDTSDFGLELSGGIATLSKTTPTNISFSGTEYILGVGLNDNPSGGELLKVFPKTNSVFDSTGNAALPIQNNNSIYLSDNLPPVITSIDLSDNNDTATISVSERVFSSISTSDTLSVENFILSLGSESNAILSSASPISILSDSNVYKLKIAIHGNTNSRDSLFIRPVTTTIIDASGNSMIAQVDDFVLLNDITPPKIKDISLSRDNQKLYLTMSEKVYNSTNQGALKPSDFDLSLNGGFAYLTGSAPTGLLVDKNILTLDISIDGNFDILDTLYVDFANTIYDSSGNLALLVQENNSVILNDISPPKIISSKLSPSNDTISIRMSEKVFGTAGGRGGIDGDDFEVSIINSVDKKVNLKSFPNPQSSQSFFKKFDFVDFRGLNIKLGNSSIGWTGSGGFVNPANGIFVGPHIAYQTFDYSTPDDDGYYLRNYTGRSDSKFAVTKPSFFIIKNAQRGDIQFTVDYASNTNLGARFVAVVDGIWYGSEQFGTSNDHGFMNSDEVTKWIENVSVNADKSNWFKSKAGPPNGYEWRDGKQWEQTVLKGLPKGDISQFGIAWLHTENNHYGAMDNFRIGNSNSDEYKFLFSFEGKGIGNEVLQINPKQSSIFDSFGNSANNSKFDSVSFFDVYPPFLITNSKEKNNILPLAKKDTINYIFSEKIASVRPYVISEKSGRHSFEYMIYDSLISLIFDPILNSLDTFNISLDSVIDFQGNILFTEDQSHFSGLIGDYDLSSSIDLNDFAHFIKSWNEKNIDYELGPVIGKAPYFSLNLDGEFDLNDGMAFYWMWHWYFENTIISNNSIPLIGDQIDIINENAMISLEPPDLTYSSEIIIDYNPLDLSIKNFDESNFDNVQNLAKIDTLNGLIILHKINSKSTIAFETNFFGNRNSNVGISYKFLDEENKVINSNYLEKEIIAVPSQFFLHQNYPNPFNPVTNINFDIPKDSKVSLAIFNTIGQEIYNFSLPNMKAGYHSVIWNGTNSKGIKVGTGVYIYQLRSNDKILNKKMLLLK